MRFAYFPGCKIPHHLPSYGAGVEAVCAALDIELVPLQFNCCGWPQRDESYLGSMYAAARNLALAAHQGLDILTPCKCCFGQLKHAQERLQRSPELARRVEELLAAEGLRPGEGRVLHLLSVLDQDLGLERLADKVVRPLGDLKAACHYGCHALRPARVTGFDNPLAPTVFERILAALGAQSVAWDLRLECCGQPLRGRDETVSRALAEKKLLSARRAGAQVLVTACTYCQMQFDMVCQTSNGQPGQGSMPRAVLITELLARALDLKLSE